MYDSSCASMTPVAHLVPLSGSSGRVTASDRLEADKAKYVKSPQVIHRRQNPAINTNFTPVLSRKLGLLPCSQLQTEHSFNNLFSSITKEGSQKQSDSVFDSYEVFQSSAIPRPSSPEQRQKRDVALSTKENNHEEAGLVFRLLQGTPLLKRSSRFSQNNSQIYNQEVPLSPRSQRGREKSCVCQPPCPTSSKIPKKPLEEQIAFTDFEAQKFFESCGLEGSLLNLLNSYQKGENTSMGSLESMDRVSCALGFAGEEKEEKTPVSVIERNARVIKWIYSCHQAQSIGEQRNKQLTRESTV
ncbi:hypothetical protein GDO81_006088 [Engystomops pustulosus]|uniref:Protein FAM110C n=1 Tax=Engystomops pustulosus TaxID=76066 RepID=A0AAV7CUY6_ENGPU|nr:hypothetical protein GDO81_006088 [Engystomops pustulosus]